MTRTVTGMVAITVLVTLGVVWHATSDVTEEPTSKRAGETVVESIYASGVVEGAAPTVELRTELSGRAVDVLVVEGEMVQESQALLKLDDREQQAQVALAESDLALAQAQLERLVNGADDAERREARGIYEAKRAEFERAQLAWQRTQGLINQRAVSQQEADDNRTGVAALQAEVAAAAARLQHVESPARADEVAMAKARIAAADARLQLARVMLDRTVLRAPSQGRVLSIDVEPGEPTGPEATEPAIRLADTRSLRVRAFVEELDATRVPVGAAARVHADGLPNREFRGTVRAVSPRMSRKVVTTHSPTERFDTKMREVLIEVEETEGLIIGLRVDVFLDVGAAGY